MDIHHCWGLTTVHEFVLSLIVQHQNKKNIGDKFREEHQASKNCCHRPFVISTQVRCIFNGPDPFPWLLITCFRKYLFVLFRSHADMFTDVGVNRIADVNAAKNQDSCWTSSALWDGSNLNLFHFYIIFPFHCPLGCIMAHNHQSAINNYHFSCVWRLLKLHSTASRRQTKREVLLPSLAAAAAAAATATTAATSAVMQINHDF